MIETRYNKGTNVVTAWWGDRFGNHDIKLKGRPDEAIVELDIPVPSLPLEAYRYYPPNDNLSVNPDYVMPYDYHARAQLLLATSPALITQPEMWELLRIFGRLLDCYSGDIDTS